MLTIRGWVRVQGYRPLEGTLLWHCCNHRHGGANGKTSEVLRYYCRSVEIRVLSDVSVCSVRTIEYKELIRLRGRR